MSNLGIQRKHLKIGIAILFLLYIGIRLRDRFGLYFPQQPRIVSPYVEVILRAPRPLSAFEQDAINVVINRRLDEMKFSAQFSVVDDESMRLEIFQYAYDENMHPLFTERGWLEYVDFSDVRSPGEYEDRLIWTTSLAESIGQSLETDETILGLDAPFESIEGVFGSSIVEEANVVEGVNFPYVVVANLRRQNGLALYRFTEDNIGGAIAIVLDGRVLDVFRVSRAIGVYQSLFGTQDEDEAERTARVLAGGTLPTALTIEKIETHCGSYCEVNSEAG